MSLISKIRKSEKEKTKEKERIRKEDSIEQRITSDLKKAKEVILENKDKLSIVFGANSPLGLFLVDELLEKGRRVRVIVRNKYRTERYYKDKLVEIHKINYKNVAQVINSVEEDSIIYNCVKVPYFKWFNNYPLVIYNLIHASKKKQAKLVHVDNLSVYGRMKTGALNEKDPLIPESDEGITRKKIAEQIIIGIQREDFESVIIRFPDIYGPYVLNQFAKNVFVRPMNNKEAKWFVDLDKKHSLIYIKDAARALIRIAEDPSAYGQIWHITGEQPITGKEFLKLVFEELGEEERISKKSKYTIKFESIFDAEMSRISDILEQWEYPFIVDGSKFQETYPEMEFTSHKEAIKKTLEWQKERLKRKRARERAWPLFRIYNPYRW